MSPRAGWFAGVAVTVSCVVACGVWSDRAANAADAALYERELDACLREGRAAHSLAVYEQCATEADRRHGLRDGGAE